MSLEGHVKTDTKTQGRKTFGAQRQRLEWSVHKPRNTKDSWRLPEARGKKGCFPQDFAECWHPDVGIPSLQDCWRTTHFLVFVVFSRTKDWTSGLCTVLYPQPFKKMFNFETESWWVTKLSRLDLNLWSYCLSFQPGLGLQVSVAPHLAKFRMF